MNYADDNYKEVYFHEYCETCKFKDVKDTDDPCNECLGEPANLHSHKPVNYKPKRGQRRNLKLMD